MIFSNFTKILVRSAPVVKDYPESLRQTEGENFVEAKLITPIMDDNE